MGSTSITIFQDECTCTKPPNNFPELFFPVWNENPEIAAFHSNVIPLIVEEIESPTYSPLLFWPNCTFRPFIRERLAFMEEMTCENCVRV